jgi:hypothetical protein
MEEHKLEKGKSELKKLKKKMSLNKGEIRIRKVKD